jgi:ATP phosphoribosyltransferase regulatory subunit HisZ
MEEWLRLPHGFRVKSEEEILRDNLLIGCFREVARQFGYRSIMTPHVGFSSTFCQNIQTTGEKTFEFTDNKGRKLMLSADSTPQIIRWYLTNFADGYPVRIHFISPIFRYRKLADRYWLQHGLASINEYLPRSLDSIDEASLAVGSHYLEILVRQLNLPVSLQLGNFGVTRLLLDECGLANGAKDEFFNSLRRIPREEWETWISLNLPDNEGREEIIKLLGYRFRFSSQSGQTTSSSETVGSISRLIDTTILFGELLAKPHGIPFEVRFDDFHSSELQSGVNFKLMRPDKGHYADGGSYYAYASKVTSNIYSFSSVAGGLKHIEKYSPLAPSQLSSGAIIVSLGHTERLCAQLVNELEARRFRARWVETTKFTNNYLAEISRGYRWLIKIGKWEYSNHQCQVINLYDNTKTSMMFSKVADWIVNATNSTSQPYL